MQTRTTDGYVVSGEATMIDIYLQYRCIDGKNRNYVARFRNG
jgi:hypothetical protein